MNFSTALVGAIILVALFFALRHVWHNVQSGKADCCGCTGCGGSAEKNVCGCGCSGNK